MFCVPYVDDQLKYREEYTGLHSLDSTTAPNIISTIEDILLLQLQNCRGQCYNRASTMAGCKAGVATTILRKGATGSLQPLLWSRSKCCCPRISES